MGRSVSFAEFRTEIRRWAQVLHNYGIGPEGRVASLLPPSIDAHALWLACALLRAYEVPINPALRGEFLDHVLTDAQIELCVVLSEDVALIEGAGLGAIEIVDVGPRLVRQPNGIPPAAFTSGTLPMEVGQLPGPDDVSCVIYTSGTTGPSKGVVISWAQMTANVGRIPRSWIDGDDAVYSPWPMFHITGRSPMCAMADVGGRVVLRPQFSVSDFWPDIEAYNCTSTTVGAVTPLLLGPAERPEDSDNPLRFILLGKVGIKDESSCAGSIVMR